MAYRRSFDVINNGTDVEGCATDMILALGKTVRLPYTDRAFTSGHASFLSHVSTMKKEVTPTNLDFTTMTQATRPSHPSLRTTQGIDRTQMFATRPWPHST